MKRALPVLALLAACSTSTTRVATGEFVAPSGLAVTSAGDRDLLFIANEGRDNLRALEMCSQPLLADGGVDPADTCPSKEDFQFVPAPIRVFPGTVETGDRPRRLAGVRLTRPDTSANKGTTGLVLAAGADSALRVVDARNIVESVAGKAAMAPVQSLALPSPAADVVAENPLDSSGMEISTPAGQSATVFVATVGGGATPAQLLMLQAGVDAQGAATLPTIVGQCSLGTVVPRKLAVVPGGGDRVYVADGAGDGVVSVAKAGFPAPADPPAACAVERLSAGGRPARSVAVSGPWTELTNDADGKPTVNTPHPAGELLVVVLEPLQASTAGGDLDPGGILIVRASDKAIVPIPPYALTETGQQPMEPIATPGLPREAAFLRAIPPDASCPLAPCTPVYIGFPTATPVSKFSLLAAVTSTDGFTYFIDVPRRRFVTTSYYIAVQEPLNTIAPLLSPSTSDPNPPTLVFMNPEGNHGLPGWFTAGVTHTAHWKVIFHSPFPGLETRSGTLTRSGTGTLFLKMPAVNLPAWTSDPALALGPGDAVTFSSYQAPAGAPQACLDVASLESQAPNRFELSIVSVPAADTLELAPLASSATVRPFDISACPAGLGVVTAVRAEGDRPWLVYDGATVRGRAKRGEPFVASERRFDYPLDYTRDAPPLSSTNVAAAFQLGGNDPALAGTGWTFSLGPGVDPVFFGDSTQSLGLATVVTAYSSPRHPQFVFTSITGGNSLVQADPSQLLSQPFGVVAYK